MIDLDSSAAIAKAATKAHTMVSAQILAEPHGPIVADLQRIADNLEAIVKDNNNLIARLESRTR